MARAFSTVHRATEWTIALALAVLTLPLLALVLASSAAVYRCWPLFVHERVGRHGRRFAFAKVRTLPPATSRYIDKHALDRVEVPRVMQLLRRTHLDELPQLWLVLAGRLSLVGPRAEMAVLHERIAPEAAAERVSVRPGVTGLWQVSVHCDGLICDRVEYDRLYVRHRNARLDLWILWSTVRKVVLGRRINLFEVPRWAIGAERAPALIDLTSAAPTVVEQTPSIVLSERPAAAFSST